MITNGFTYIAVLVFIAAVLITLEHKTTWKLFEYVPPIVLLYLGTMILCTVKFWDLEATAPAYGALKNNILYAMIFLMLLRCDIRKVLKLGPKMLFTFFTASISISIGFILTYAIMHEYLGPGSWKGLAALCGSWMGGSGNMVAIQAALDISEAEMGYALVIDSIDYSIWVMFLLWAITKAPQFNKWTKADTTLLDEVSKSLEDEMNSNKNEITFQSIMLLTGSALLVSALTQNMGVYLNGLMPLFDKATWTVIAITVIALFAATTPLGKVAGSTELSNVFLYTIVALLASRANLAELKDAPIWILSGFMILGFHGIVMVVMAKIFKLDMFTSAVASLANIGGTASAPVLAAAYSGSLVPVAILMALMGYIIGTFGGLITGNIMSIFG